MEYTDKSNSVLELATFFPFTICQLLCWDATHNKTVFLHSHPLSLFVSYISSTHTIIPINGKKKKNHVHLNTFKDSTCHAVPLRLRFIFNHSPLKFRILSLSFEILPVSRSELSSFPFQLPLSFTLLLPPIFWISIPC